MYKQHLSPMELMKGILPIIGVLGFFTLPLIIIMYLGYPLYYGILSSTYFIYTVVFFRTAFFSMDSVGFLKIKDWFIVFFSYVVITGIYLDLLFLVSNFNSLLFTWTLTIIFAFSHLWFSFIRSFTCMWNPWLW